LIGTAMASAIHSFSPFQGDTMISAPVSPPFSFWWTQLSVPNIRNLAKVRVHPLGAHRLPKSVFMHAGRAACDDHPFQSFLTDGFPDGLLSRLGAHVDVVGAVGHILDLPHLLGDRLDIHGPRYIDATMADKNSEFFHDQEPKQTNRNLGMME
jgi:hypothetical protein